MKRKTMKTMRYITVGAAAAVVGLLIAEGITANAQADAQLEQIDRFIEANKVTRHYKHDSGTETIELTTLTVAEPETETEPTARAYTVEEFIDNGVIEMDGWKFTWYSEQVLPGEGLNIPGRWSDGQFVRDENGYLCVACNDLEKGSHVMTPFGEAIVYDAVGLDWDGTMVTGVVDLYVSW